MTIKGARVALAVAGSLGIPALVSLVALDETAMPMAEGTEAELPEAASVVATPVLTEAAFPGLALAEGPVRPAAEGQSPEGPIASLSDPNTGTLSILQPAASHPGWYDAEGEMAADEGLRMLQVLTTSVADSLLEAPYRIGSERRVVEVRSGDTLLALLTRENISRADAHAVVDALEEVYDPRGLQIGQQITLSFEHQGRDSRFLGLELMPDVETFASVQRAEDGTYSAGETANALVTQSVAAGGTITSSLAGDTNAAGVPYQVLHGIIRAYSYDVDFQRDLQPGDSFEILFEQDYHADGEFARHGVAVFANLVLSGEARPIYRFESSDGTVDYYDAEGQSVRKALLRTPVDSLRMSSGFGMRRHPILGYTRMHRGVDFAGPTGTPIFAAGDGVIDFLGTNRGYGKYIRIRHNNGLQTAYAHMSRYGRGLTAGSRVQQGQVIGYIGSTGMSTGPHLHYEVIVNGQQVNPLSIDMPTGRTLEGEELARFRQQVAAYEAEFHQQMLLRQVAEMPGE